MIYKNKFDFLPNFDDCQPTLYSITQSIETKLECLNAIF